MLLLSDFLRPGAAVLRVVVTLQLPLLLPRLVRGGCCTFGLARMRLGQRFSPLAEAFLADWVLLKLSALV
jgi:hypothetical protein